MRMSFAAEKERGLTLVEILVILMVIACILLVFWPRPLAQATAKAGPRIRCMNNLRQVGLSYDNWEADHGYNYPMAVPGTNGGSMEFIMGLNAFRHFQVLSNELGTPKILICPAESERNRKWTTNFTVFGNANISYFVGIISNGNNPSLLLSGDRNITNRTSIKNGILTLTTNELAGWTSRFHNKVGNILLADGSVQQDSILGLQNQIAGTGVVTNRLQMPVPGP